MKRLLKKLLPVQVFSLYHLFVAILAAVIYRFPSKRLTVIGVTGTNGKSTVVNLAAKILEAAGHRVGLTSTVNFKVGERTWLNDTKMTMRGRFSLQALLRRMVSEHCDYAIVETTSEGIKQYRHWGIYYDVAVFTNLTPEHIESHGSFEKYRQAKGKLFQALNSRVKPKIKKISIVNLDDPAADYFLSFPAQQKYGFTVKENIAPSGNLKIVRGSNITDDTEGVKLLVNGQPVKLALRGRFNAYNALAAVCVGLAQNISLDKIIQALEQVRGVPGRMQFIDEGQPFEVIVDYAHEPAGLEQVYQSLKSYQPHRIIAVLGSQGGGRDKRKRPLLGELAGRYTDYCIVTNEDPYDDDPIKIIDEVIAGIKKYPDKIEGQHYFKILDREEAIRKALALAYENDIVVITGKGSEQNMVIRGGKKIPWNDEQTVRRLLKK
ncbi:MAG: UDP-N-acetylmuramoyl-L-alanyl-D-glutamate--2,6-diaminopimelate ligase [Patescibacteria group bacterium]|nr:UDP-N-acetylmuramoyl-L-alanyl-D-glutamate--2,6-diaminopimelate ligase [Patescibacteria group bacterium]